MLAGVRCQVSGINPKLLTPLFFIWIVFIGLAYPPVTSGYVLQGPHLLDLMVRKLSGANSLLVEQQVVIEDSSIAEHPLELNETLRFIFPDRFRSDTQYEDTQRIHVVVQDQILTVIDEVITADHEGRFDRYKDLLLYHSRQLLHKALLLNGVDVGVTSLARDGERIVYVIGAQHPDEPVSQVWVDKERFLPLRWVSVDSFDQHERLEFVYRNWRKTGDVWYPMLIESYLNQRLIRVIRVQNLKVNAEFEADLLNLDYLLNAYLPDEPEETPAQPESEVDEVQRTIDDFKKKFEP